MAKKNPAIPLKTVMAAIDRKDRDFYNNLSTDEKKSFSTWMVMRYASSFEGPMSAHYLFMVNELVNKNFMDINKHPELQWLSLSACGTGKVGFHPWIKPANSKKKKNKVNKFLCDLYPHMKLEDIDMLADINSLDELKQLAKDNGYTDKELKDIFGKV